jgi:hypothetical protein
MDLVSAVKSGKPFRRRSDTKDYGADFWIGSDDLKRTFWPTIGK